MALEGLYLLLRPPRKAAFMWWNGFVPVDEEASIGGKDLQLKKLYNGETTSCVDDAYATGTNRVYDINYRQTPNAYTRHHMASTSDKVYWCVRCVIAMQEATDILAVEKLILKFERSVESRINECTGDSTSRNCNAIEMV